MKFKKIKALILAVTLIFAFGATACGNDTGGGGHKIDPNKTQIYVHIANGGYGYAWLEKAAEDWGKEAGNEKYEVIVNPSIDEDPQSVIDNYKSGTSDDVYFFSHAGIRSIISAGVLADINDIMSQKPDDKLTLEEYLLNSDSVRSAFSSDDKSSLYAIPYGDSFLGLTFDFDLFQKNNWLFTDANGDLTVGKDKKPNTYDDGQPQNMQEWDIMLEKIKNTANSYPFIYNTKFLSYQDHLFYGVMAQYAGVNDFKTFINYEGDYTDENGNIVTVPLSEGYKVYDMPAFKKASEFMKNTLFSNAKNVHPSSWGSQELSHRDAQNKFILGKVPTASVPTGAMLGEGIWWENEARPMFKSLSERGLEDRGFGKVEYRYMLIPSLEGQKGGNGDGSGSVFSSMDSGAAFVVKNENKEKEAKAKNFLLFSSKEKYMKMLTTTSGAMRPYKYTLTADELAKMTPLQRNVYAIYHDTENIKIVRPSLDQYASKINYVTTKQPDRLYAKSSLGGYGVAKSLLSLDVNTYISSVRSYNSSNWDKFMKELTR